MGRDVGQYIPVSNFIPRGRLSLGRHQSRLQDARAQGRAVLHAHVGASELGQVHSYYKDLGLCSVSHGMKRVLADVLYMLKPDILKLHGGSGLSCV